VHQRSPQKARAAPGPLILAVDLGSSAFKASVFDAALRQHGAGEGRLATRHAPGGCVELDIAAVREACRGAMAGALQAARVRPASVAAIAITSQAQTFTVLDRRNQPLIPFRSWQDTRAAATCAELERSGALRAMPRHAGLHAPLPVLQLVQLAHLRRNEPALLKATRLVLPLPSFFIRELTGAEVTDDNLAAMSGLYSLPQHGWWPVALRLCGLAPAQLPRLVAVGGVAAHTGAGAVEYGLPVGVPVVAAGNDQTAGACGLRLERRPTPLLTLGTAQVAYVVSAELPPSAPGVMRGPYPGGRWFRLVAEDGGNVLAWARRALAGCATERAFSTAARRAGPPCDGLVFDLDLAAGQGGWRGAGLHHGPGDLAWAVVERLAERLAQRVAQLTDGQMLTGPVPVAGGGAADPLWRSLLSARLGVALRRTRVSPLQGAARMAAQRGLRAEG
jgi:xylulokinase